MKDIVLLDNANRISFQLITEDINMYWSFPIIEDQIDKYRLIRPSDYSFYFKDDCSHGELGVISPIVTLERAANSYTMTWDFYSATNVNSNDWIKIGKACVLEFMAVE